MIGRVAIAVGGALVGMVVAFLLNLALALFAGSHIPGQEISAAILAVVAIGLGILALRSKRLSQNGMIFTVAVCAGALGAFTVCFGIYTQR